MFPANTTLKYQFQSHLLEKINNGYLPYLLRKITSCEILIAMYDIV